MSRLNNLLAYLTKHVKNDAATPRIVDGFWMDYIESSYPSLNQKIKIYYSWGQYEIKKYENDSLIFEALVKDVNKNSNATESLVKDIYNVIYVSNSQE